MSTNKIKNILVIEDARTINTVITKELGRQGFDVAQAYTFAEAKNAIEKEDFGLIILDLHLPDGEGSELIAHIQSLTRTKVVVLTALTDDDLREELFQYGILDYIIKDTNLLYSIVEIIRVIEKIEHKNAETVLVIDDSTFICKQIRTILEPRNYRVITAHDAHSGLQKLADNSVDLLILDMELPDMHGEKVLELIRRDVRYLSLPILVLSGTATAETIRNVLKNGASDFLKKPFVYEEFVLKVDLWIDYFKQKKALKEKTHQLQFLNENLEKLVYEGIQKNREKDKMMFQQFRQAQMGEMLSMIAHQWRQPLNAIGAAVSVINLRVQRGKFDLETAKEVSTKINRYIQHLSTTIDDFRDFFKPQKERRVTNFEVIFSKAHALIEDAYTVKNISLHTQVGEIESFLTHENELVQVVLSILKNAEDALMERNVPDPCVCVEIDGVTMRIHDNAGGIDKAIIEKIFDPYFSTKSQKNGTGLGLYMSKTIVEEHCCGHLEVQNRENGAEFAITLPKNDGDSR